MRLLFRLLLIAVIVLLTCKSYAGVVTTQKIPWSGYWWPFTQGGLGTGAGYRGYPSPIEKYLLWTTNRDRGALKDWYLQYYYDPRAPGWHGLCGLWSRAAMAESYDILPSTEDNVIWRVGDKKGLLLLCHDYYIQINESGRDPVIFHQWLLDYIGIQRVPFLSDLDSGDEVWNYPIYGYKMTSTTSGASLQITADIYFPDNKVFPDYVGTLERSKRYTYSLDLNARGEIIGGRWTGKSVANHPDTLGFLVSSGPKCPYIDCDEVRRLARAKDDFLEPAGNAAAVPLDSGTYHLVLLNEDRYLLQGRAGDTIYLEAAKDDTSNESVQISIADIFGETAASWVLNSTAPTALTLELRNPPYTLSLTQKNYTRDPNIYTLSLSRRTFYEQHVPYIPKSGPWSSFMMLNAGEERVEEVALVSYDRDGRPIQTLLGPVDFAPYEKQLVMFNDLPWRIHEYAASDSVRLISNDPLNMLNVFAINQNPMAGFVQDSAVGSHLVIPGTVTEIEAAGNLSGAVTNESFKEVAVTFRLYNLDGRQQGEDLAAIIPPGGKYFFNPGSGPFYHFPRRGWLDIRADEGNILSAYQYVRNSAGNRNVIDTLFALPVERKNLIVPHVTPMLGWWRTYLTLINPNDVDNPVNLHFAAAGQDRTDDMDLEFAPYEKRVIDLTASHGSFFDGVIARSILEITGQHPIVGYYTYSPPYGKDEASFPLISDDMLKPRLILPHYAGQGGQFWTGICVFNPNQHAVNVSVQPYDGSGQPLDDLAVTMALGASEKKIFTVHSKFGDAAADISFIVFEEKSSSPIGGFYQYGNNKDGKPSVEMLTGANM